jgi:hypothetical protein
VVICAHITPLVVMLLVHVGYIWVDALKQGTSTVSVGVTVCHCHRSSFGNSKAPLQVLYGVCAGRQG